MRFKIEPSGYAVRLPLAGPLFFSQTRNARGVSRESPCAARGTDRLALKT